MPFILLFELASILFRNTIFPTSSLGRCTYVVSTRMMCVGRDTNVCIRIAIHEHLLHIHKRIWFLTYWCVSVSADMGVMPRRRSLLAWLLMTIYGICIAQQGKKAAITPIPCRHWPLFLLIYILTLFSESEINACRQASNEWENKRRVSGLLYMMDMKMW